MEFVDYTIGELMNSLKTGKTPKTSNSEYFDGDIVWMTPSDFKGQKYAVTSERTITAVALEKNEAQLYETNTVLISTIGDIGKVAIVKKPVSANQQITGVKINENILLPELFYYWLILNKKILENKANRAIISQLNNKLLRRISLKFPKELKDQQNFILYLNKTQELIDLRITSIKKLDDYIKSLFFESFGDPIHDNKGLGKKTLSFYGKWRTGSTPPKNSSLYYSGDIPWLTSGELNETYTYTSKNHITQSALSETSVKKVEANSLLIGMYDTAALKISIIKVDASCNQAIAFSKLDEEKCHPLFIYYNLLYSRDYYLNKRKGARQKNFKLSMIESLEILDAKPLHQKDFANKVERILTLITKYQIHLDHLKILFQSTLQKAFTDDTEIDENLFFEDILPNLNLNDLKEKRRLNILIDWMNKKNNRFTTFEKYDEAYKIILDLLNDGTLEQEFIQNGIILKIKQ